MQVTMSEKAESAEFDEEDVEEVAPGNEDGDLDHLMRDFESQRRRAPKSGTEPAWRRLERLREERHTAELVSDFEDYAIGDEEFAEAAGGGGALRKKKRAR
jgi:hypothetical protein